MLIRFFSAEPFANNLVSSELSVILLEEYIIENDGLVERIVDAISDMSHKKALVPLQQLLLNAKVMSASNLINITEQMSASVQQQNYEQAKLLVVELYNEMNVIAKYSNNI